MDYKDEDELLKKENVAEEEFIYDEEAAEDYEANQVFMTPGQMVFRRFMRNRLAVVGICAIVFIFSTTVISICLRSRFRSFSKICFSFA